MTQNNTNILEKLFIDQLSRNLNVTPLRQLPISASVDDLLAFEVLKKSASVDEKTQINKFLKAQSRYQLQAMKLLNNNKRLQYVFGYNASD